MLLSLSVQDFVIVDQLQLDFNSGFTVFSGETGAGKSILIDALLLALGGRAEKNMIREGASKTDICAVFEVPETLKDWAQSQDLEEDTLILRRVYDLQGKSRAWINGKPSTLAQLKEVGAALVDIHGQHAHQGLLKSSIQRQLLDAAHPDAVEAVAKAYRAWQTAQREWEAAIAQQATQAEQYDRLQWVVGELKALELQENEWEGLTQEHKRLSNMGQLIEGTQAALSCLEDESAGALLALDRATHFLAQIQSDDAEVAPWLEQLESARITCQEVASDLNHYAQRLEADPERFAQLDERMRQLFAAARRFRVQPEGLYAFYLQSQQELEQVAARVDVAALQAAVEAAQQAWQVQADALSAARQKAAKKLSAGITKAMQELAMKGGCFEVQLLAAEPSAQGQEQVQFWVAGHAGVAAQPLSKVASGGELARIALAVALHTRQGNTVPTLIFDEVDTGIGGAVAEVVGRFLQDLAQDSQVLCVTHLPQVASCAAHHFQVSKSFDGQHTRSHIQVLNAEERVHEIARMLGGLNLSQTTQAHAAEMLQQSQHFLKKKA